MLAVGSVAASLSDGSQVAEVLLKSLSELCWVHVVKAANDTIILQDAEVSIWIYNTHEVVEVLFSGDSLARSEGSFTADLADIIGCSRTVMPISYISVWD